MNFFLNSEKMYNLEFEDAILNQLCPPKPVYWEIKSLVSLGAIERHDTCTGEYLSTIFMITKTNSKSFRLI